MVYSLDFFNRLICTRSEKEQCVEIIASILRFSIKSRREGLLSLEQDIELIDDAIMRKGFELVVGGSAFEPETVRDILTNRILASNLQGIDLLMAIIKIEGILAIQEGCNPRIVADKLAAFLGEDIDLWESSDWESTIYNQDDGISDTTTDVNTIAVGSEDDIKVPDTQQWEANVNVIIGDIYFESISRLQDRDIQKLLRQMSTQELALALKDSTDVLKCSIYRNMSARASTMLREEIECLGPVMLSSIEIAQKKMLNILRKLVELGEINLSDGDDSK